MFSKTVIAASMASLAYALPQGAPSSGTGEAGTFSLIASHSGDINVHLRGIVANGRELFIGKDTGSYCPDTVVDCTNYPGTQTVFSTGGTGTASLAVAVPGGQQLYVAADGHVGYTGPHSAAIPEGALLSPFKYTAPASEGSTGTLEGPGGFFACPTGNPGEYQIKADINPDLSFIGCIGIGLAAAPSQINAWEYT